jgi:hypothetical protein
MQGFGGFQRVKMASYLQIIKKFWQESDFFRMFLIENAVSWCILTPLRDFSAVLRENFLLFPFRILEKRLCLKRKSSSAILPGSIAVPPVSLSLKRKNFPMFHFK